MVKKMFEALKKRYSNLGQSDELLTSVASMAIIGLPADADEAAIEARASESAVGEMLKSMQSQLDRLRTKNNVLSDPKSNEGGYKPNIGSDSKIDEVLKLLTEQKDANAAMQKRLEALEGANKAKDFDSLVGRIGKELNISAGLLDLCKQGLSSDMDEKAVRDALGAKKKALIEEGVRFNDGFPPHSNATQTEAEQKEALDWAKRHEIKDED